MFDPKSLQSAFRAAGKPLYLVGGAVRDQLLGKPCKDYDYTTAATPPEIKAILKGAGLPVIPVGEAFGTIATIVPENFPSEDVDLVEITTFRCEESYKKGSRKPTVKFGESLEEDLRRRDLTVNAMARGDDGTIIDPFGGQEHLKQHLLVTPMDPVETFSQDPLRMLRVARFVAQLGFDVDPKTWAAMTEKAGLVLTISRERWKQEMDKLLCGEFVEKGLRCLADTRLLQHILPEFMSMLLMKGQGQGKYHAYDIWSHTLKVVEGVPKHNHVLRWAALLHDVAKPHTRTVHNTPDIKSMSPEPVETIHFLQHSELGAEMAEGIADRFKFSRDEKNRVKFLVENHLRPNFYSSDWRDGTVRSLAEDAGDNLDDLMALSRSDVSASHTDRDLSALDELTQRIKTLKEAKSLIPDLPAGIGGALMAAFSLTPGPEVGKLKGKLMDAIREGKIAGGSSPEVYVEYLKLASTTDAKPENPA